MRLENLLALTHGELLNEPCVNSFQNPIFEVHRVKRGDLFFAYAVEDISTAIQNGAYIIIFDEDVEICDEEIAWIRVDAIDDALKRLLRFKMLEKEVVVYRSNEIVQKLALQVITQTDFLVVNGDMQTVFKSLWEINRRTTLLFCPALNSSDIFTNIKELPKIAQKPIEIMEQTLFETSFIYDNTFYERQLLSPFFIPYLEELLHLYRVLKINYRLRKFTPIEHFEAVFTNKNLEIKSFGASDKVLIFEPNASLIEREIEFLRERASWANIIFLVPSSIDIALNEDIYTYKDETGLFEILKTYSFNFALVVGVNRSILEKQRASETQLTLDF